MNRSYAKSSDEIQDCVNRMDNLTRREIQVFNLLTTGNLPKQIAAELNMSINTVIDHESNIYEKLCVQKMADLIKISFVWQKVGKA